MKYLLRVGLIIVFSILSPLVQAQKIQDADGNEIDCEKEVPNNTVDIKESLYLSHKKADKELNDVYRKLIDFYKKEFEEAKTGDPDYLDSFKKPYEYLRQSQRDWIKFRDSFCDFDASHFLGGTWEPVAYMSCQIVLTEQQTEKLKHFLKAKEEE